MDAANLMRYRLTGCVKVIVKEIGPEVQQERERDRERATAPGWSWRDLICVVTNGETIITELSVELMDKML